MKLNRLYRIEPETKAIHSVTEVDFAQSGFKERYDIQEWICKNPIILGEDLLIIAKEKSVFLGTSERPDLIALDKEGNVVIIELKRDDSGTGVEWQAIKYASYWSRFKPEEIVNVFSGYLQDLNPEEEMDTDLAAQRIQEFIEDDSLDSLNARQRIIIASHRFAREVTSAVNWLIERYSLDVRCIQLIPYHDKDRNSFYIQAFQLLPLMPLEDLIIGPASERSDGIQGGRRLDDEFTKACARIKSIVLGHIGGLGSTIKTSRWAARGYTGRYFHFWFSDGLWDNHSMSYRFHMPVDGHGTAIISFWAYKPYLSGHGLTDSMINDIQHFIGTQPLKATRTNAVDTWISVEYDISMNGFTAEFEQEVGQGIATLIKETYTEINAKISSNGDFA